MRETMFVFNGFTQKANTAVNEAMQIASDLGHTGVGSEHILYGLLSDDTSVSQTLLEKNKITSEEIEQKLKVVFGTGVVNTLTPNDLTPRSKRILENSISQAKTLGHKYVGTEHILLSMLKEPDCYGVMFLQELGVNVKELYKNSVSEITKSNQANQSNPNTYVKPSKAGNSKNHIMEYGKDLTQQAKQNTLDPVIGREKEIERVTQILSRRTKNNPCLVGEPGVGKTAVIEGLAQKIAKGEVPETIQNKRIVTLDLTAMLAGAKYRGDFEDRIKKVLEQVILQGDIILFIDEIHNIIGAGAAEGAIDAANILKPQLARGEIQLIGATTIEEYRKHIEKDTALERRFQPVTIEEPSVEDSIQILYGLRDKYEVHHKLKINDEAIISAVTLSDRYISDRFLPDKAIDLMDESASRVRLKAYTTSPDLEELEKLVKDVGIEKSEAIHGQDFELAAKYRDKEKTLLIELEQAKQSWNKSRIAVVDEVTTNDIADIVASWTGVEVQQITQKESTRLLNLEERLHQRIVGQNQAVTAISNAIRRGRVGLKDPKRPMGSFLFLGPTGVGKTEVCKALADVMFGNEQAMIRLDMSEYMEKHAVSRMIGAPPGYIGYEEGGQLTEKIRRKPYSVVLFDEIEKAHPDIFNILLQILEDGMLTDSQGRSVNFRNTILIMTSNIGATLLTEKKKLGFSGEDSDIVDDEKDKILILNELKKHFKPELLNRLDENIVFHKLDEIHIKEIAKNMLAVVQERVKQLDVELIVSIETVEQIAKIGYDKVYGARPLRRAITAHIEDKLAQKFLDGSIKKFDRVSVDVEHGEFVYKNV